MDFGLRDTPPLLGGASGEHRARGLAARRRPAVCCITAVGSHRVHVDTTFVQSAKLAVVAATGLSKDALHVHVGLLVYLAVAVITRRPMRSVIPWLAVLLVALTGEIIDLRNELAVVGHWRWSASVHDLVNTMLWPTVLFVGLRFSRGLAGPRT